MSRQTFTRFLRNPSKKICSAMFKTKGGGGQRRFEQCSKKLQIWWRGASLNWDSQIQTYIEEFSMFAVYVKYWTINHFSHSYKRRHLLAIFSSNPSFWKFPFWGIPRFGNFHFEGSLISGILGQAWNKQFFWGGFARFLYCFLLFHQ